jgi:hypothetical protein
VAEVEGSYIKPIVKWFRYLTGQLELVAFMHDSIWSSCLTILQSSVLLPAHQLSLSASSAGPRRIILKRSNACSRRRRQSTILERLSRSFPVRSNISPNWRSMISGDSHRATFPQVSKHFSPDFESIEF